MDTKHRRIKQYIGTKLSDLPEADYDLIPFLYLKNIRSKATAAKNYTTWGLVYQRNDKYWWEAHVQYRNNVKSGGSIGLSNAIIAGDIQDYYQRLLGEILISGAVVSQQLVEILDTKMGGYWDGGLHPETKKLFQYCCDTYLMDENYMLPMRQRWLNSKRK